MTIVVRVRTVRDPAGSTCAVAEHSASSPRRCPSAAYPHGMSDLHFADDKTASRFTLHRGDDLVSVLDYRDDGRTIALTRAFTIPTYRGHGYAAIVTERAVDAIEAAGQREVIPVCWYVGEWFDAHPERAGILHRRPAS